MFRPLGISIPILFLALIHGLFFAVMLPPWDLYDEGTHLAYALVLRDQRRIPHLEETTRTDIVESEIETERWDRFQIGRPDTSSLEAMGLGGRLYQGYQPPLYYLMIAPVTYAGDGALGALYAARAPGAVMLTLLTAITWMLGRLWARSEQAMIPAVAALMVAVTPAAASAAGRVNNDLTAAVLIAGGFVAATLLIQRPSTVHAVALALLTSLAVLTKSHGILLLATAFVSVAMLWRTNRLTGTIAALSIVPGAAVAGVWALWTQQRYGVWTGTEAFLAFAQPFDPLPATEFIRAIIFNTWSSYWATYDAGTLELSTGLGLLTIVAIGVGLLFFRGGVAGEASVLSALAAVGMLALLWYGNASGLVYPQGRILLPAMPMAAVLVAAGWSRLGGRFSGFVPAVCAIVASAAFTVGWFLPFFY